MLAAARNADAGRSEGGAVSSSAAQRRKNPAPAAAAPEPEPAEQAEAPAPAAPKPAKPAAPVKAASAGGGAGGRPSVAEMMAAARPRRRPKRRRPRGRSRQAGVAKPAPPKPAAAKAPAAKAAPAAAKPATAAAQKAAPAEPKQTGSILAAARGDKPGPMTKAEAAAKPQPPRENVAAAKAKLTRAADAAQAGVCQAASPESQAAESKSAAACCTLLLGSFLGVGIHVAVGHWRIVDAGTAAVHVPQHPDRAAEQVQSRLPQQLFAGPGRDAIRRPVRRVGRELRIQRPARKSTPCGPSAPTWAARRTGWKASRSSNAPATAAVFIRTASTSKVRPRARWSAMPFAWPTTANWKSTRARLFQEELGQWTDPGVVRAGLTHVGRAASGTVAACQVAR